MSPVPAETETSGLFENSPISCSSSQRGTTDYTGVKNPETAKIAVDAVSREHFFFFTDKWL
jgi:hypothetical protein